MQIRPSINLSILPAALSFVERFALAANAGFGGIELEALAGPTEALREASDRTGVSIHSVHCRANYRLPLSSSDRDVAAAGVKATLDAIDMAERLGADTLLLIPGVVGAEASYLDVYERSRDVILRDVLPVARDRGVTLAIENVWNGFLLSPIDFAKYIDELNSPWIRAYLDVGNAIFGHPEGWIDILGTRICKLHLKDFTFNRERGRRACKIGSGDVDWARVRAALERIGYSGWGVLAEADLSQRWPMPQAYHRLIGYRPRAAGLEAPVGAAQAVLARSLLRDAMSRFRRHLDCSPPAKPPPERTALSHRRLA